MYMIIITNGFYRITDQRSNFHAGFLFDLIEAALCIPLHSRASSPTCSDQLPIRVNKTPHRSPQTPISASVQSSHPFGSISSPLLPRRREGKPLPKGVIVWCTGGRGKMRDTHASELRGSRRGRERSPWRGRRAGDKQMNAIKEDVSSTRSDHHRLLHQWHLLRERPARIQSFGGSSFPPISSPGRHLPLPRPQQHPVDLPSSLALSCSTH